MASDEYAGRFDARLTTLGLLFETQEGLADALAPRVEAEAGVAPQLFGILLRLARSPGHALRMSDLAAQVSLSPSGLTRAVDRLERAGLVERASCPTDRRGSLAVLTDEGLRRVDATLPGHVGDIDRLFTGLLTPDELAAFTATLRKLRDHVRPTAAQVSPVPGGAAQLP
jgi:MarR family transcriptional regulator, 2-MHQ and catechol-resistance regulon repressor